MLPVVLLALTMVGCPSSTPSPEDTGVPSCDDPACTDVDEDGHFADEDCDDADPTVHPGADEHCDGRDEDCDGDIDEEPVDATTWYGDRDLDGYGTPDESYVRCEPYTATVSNSEDCDDTDPLVHPGAEEHCDRRDEDCDGEVDEDPVDEPWWYQDMDGDGHGDPSSGVQACEAPSALIADGTDCDDLDPSIHPGADELCNLVDDNCDGLGDQRVAGRTEATVQEALDTACEEGDTVWVLPGTWTENLVWPHQSLTLSSIDGPETTILDGSGCSGTECSVLVVRDNPEVEVNLDGLTITGGYAEYGGGVSLGWVGEATFTDCVFETNEAEQWGGECGMRGRATRSIS